MHWSNYSFPHFAVSNREANLVAMQRIRIPRTYSIRSPHTPKPEEIYRGVRGIPVMMSYATVPSGTFPTASTINMFRTRRTSPRVNSRRAIVIVRAIPIVTPFSYIPRHIIQSIPIRRKYAHWSGIRKATPSEIGMICSTRIRAGIIAVCASLGLVIRIAMVYSRTPRETLTAQSTTRSVLPFRLRRQTVTVSAEIAIRCTFSCFVYATSHSIAGN